MSTLPRRDVSGPSLPCSSGVARASLLVMVLCAASALAQEATRGLPPVGFYGGPGDDRPRVEYVVKELVAEGSVAGKLAKVRMRVQVQVFEKAQQGKKPTFVQVPLFSTNAAVSEVKVTSKAKAPSAYVLRDEAGVRFVAADPGEYQLELEVIAPVVEQERRKSLVLPLVIAAKSTVTLNVPELEIEVKAKPALGIETTEAQGATAVTVYGGAAPEVELTWTRKAPEKKLEAVVFAEQDTLVEITRGACRVDSVVTYAILQSKVDEFKVGLPADCTLLNVAGEDIRSWDVADQAGRKVLVVSLLNAAKGKYELRLKLEKVVPQIPASIPVPQIDVLNVEREKGTVAIAAAKGMQVEATDTKGVVQVDVKETPPQLQQMSKAVPLSAIHLCFRYLRRPFEVTIKADEIAAKVSAELQTDVHVGLTSMRVHSSIHYTIRDAGVFQFKVGVGPDTKLVSVDGQNINTWEFDDKQHVLSVDMRSKAENSYVLEIELERELKAGPASQAGIRQVTNAEVPSIQALGVDRQRGYIVVSALPGMKVEPEVTANASQVDVRELPEPLRPKRDTVAIGYRYIKEGYRVSVKVSEVQPEVTAEVAHLVTVEEKSVQIETTIAYKIRKAGIFQLRVQMPSALRRRPAEGENIDDETYDEAKQLLTINLKSKVEKQYTLTLRNEMQLEEGLTEDIEKTKDIVVPEVRPLGVEKERGHIGVHTQATLRLKKKPNAVKGLRDIDIRDLPAEMIRKAPKLSLAFQYFEPAWQLQLLAEPIKPRVTVETFNFVSLGEDIMAVSACAKFDIQHAGIAEFLVQMPRGATNVDIEGDEIKHKEKVASAATKTAAPDVRKITLHAKRQGTYDLFFTFEIKLEKGKGPYTYEGIQIKGHMKEVERETGYLAVAAREDVEVSLPETSPYENLTPVDEKEIPAGYREGITLPILLSFRYLAHPVKLQLNVKRHASAEVVVAVIESAKLDTVVTEEGETITDMVCDVRNSREQYLTLYLPSEARIWHAFVGGRSVRPLTETSEGKAVTKLPIAQVGKEDQSFKVRLRYSTQGDKLGAMGLLHLEFPTVNLVIMRLGWVLKLPEGYDVLRDSGTLKRIEKESQFEYRLRNLEVDVAATRQSEVQQRPSRSVNRQTRDRQYLNVQRAIVNVQQSQSKQMDGAGQAVATKSIYTGAKPDLPNRFFFQGLIIPTGRPVVIRSRYLKESIGLPSQAAMLIVCASLLAWAWAKLGLAILPKLGIYVALALLCLGIRTMAEGSYAGQLAWLIGIIAIVPALGLVLKLGTWIRGRCRRSPSA